MTADAIAMKLGVEKTAMIRVRAGIAYALSEAMDDGHCGLPEKELLPLAAQAARGHRTIWSGPPWTSSWPTATVVAGTVSGTECVFLARLYRAERTIAERMLRIADGRTPWPGVDVDRALPWVEQRTGLSLVGSQTDAIRLALTSKVVVVTGGPGVGKTTLVNAILRVLAAKGREHDAVRARPEGRPSA